MDEFATLERDVPLVLLPVRLETKFDRNSGAADTLRVRIYPDEVHADRHDPRLSSPERAAALEYWRATWRGDSCAATDPNAAHTRRRMAWDDLCRKVGPNRAAWVTAATRPPRDDRPTAPVKDAEPLPRDPVLAEVPRREDPWARPPIATALPAFWRVLIYQGDRLVAEKEGGAIQPDLVLAPTPGTVKKRSDMADPTDLPLDDSVRWLVDYKRAEDAGMAVTIKLTDDPRFDPRRAAPLISRVLVIGIVQEGPAASAARIEKLLQTHQYGAGLGFVPQGAPSNNTEASDSAWSSERVSPFRDVRDESVTPAGTTNRTVVLHALGLSSGAFAHIEHGDLDEQLESRAMQVALWPATLGYWLDTLLSGEIPSADWPAGLTDRLRDHFLDFVRARGPLPVLRIGRQPYGLLPTTSLTLMADQAAGERRVIRELVRFLRVMAPFWAAGIEDVPHVGTGGASAVVPALGWNATSQAIRVRSVESILACRSAGAFFEASGSGSCADVETLSKAVAAALGATYIGGTLALAVSHEDSYRLGMPLVVPAIDDGEAALRSFLTTRFARFVLQPAEAPRSLLAILAHHAATLASADAAVRRNNPNRDLTIRDSVVGGVLDSSITAAIAGAARAPSRMEVLTSTVVRDGAQSVAMAEIIADETTRVHEALGNTAVDALSGLVRERIAELGAESTQELVEMNAAFDYLAGMPVDRLELALRELLDLCSHRLDAWVTSLASHRLAAFRATKPTGAHLGAYGWVEDLHPDSGVPAGAGYVHAPSVQQATTAALLKAGHSAHGAGTGERPFAIDLSGPRTRAAVSMLEAMSEGQPLAAVLGYRFERRLHDALEHNLVLEQYVEPLRRLAPLGPQSPLVLADEPTESIRANNVVDGLRLLELRDEEAVAGPDGGWAPVILSVRLRDNAEGVRAAHRQPLIDLLNTLSDDADAVADVLLAESVHQFCLGNNERSAAVLASLSGTAPPPWPLEVLRTPRPGRAVSHRVLAACHTDRTGAGWTKTARSKAEPRLNAWAAAQLGDPAHIRLRYAFVDAERVAAPDAVPARAWKEITISDLKLAPLDVVYLVDGDDPSQTSLARVLTHHVLANERSRRDAEHVALTAGRAASWRAEDIGLVELTEIASRVRRVLSAGRPAEPRDFRSAHEAEEADSPGIDVDELGDRAKTAAASFNGAVEQLAETLDGLEPGAIGIGTAKEQLTDAAGAEANERDNLSDALESAIAAASGAAAAVVKPLEKLWTMGHGVQPMSDWTPDEVYEHGTAILGAVQAKVAAIDEALKRGTVAGYLRACAAIFGESFRVVPLLNADARRRQTFGALDVSSPQDDDPVSTWLNRMATVRPALGPLADLELYARTLGHERTSFIVGQAPDRLPGERWVGVAAPPKERKAGTLGLLASVPDSIDWARQLAALVVDEWTEVIPSERQTTGVALHANAPGARPPQAILLAVHPDPSQPWSRDIAADVLISTLQLSKMRAVDLESIRWMGRFLPALYVPTSELGDVSYIPLTQIVREFSEAAVHSEWFQP